MYPRRYFPDLTTGARPEEINSEDLAAFDLLVGAMAVGLFGFSRRGRQVDDLSVCRSLKVTTQSDRYFRPSSFDSSQIRLPSSKSNYCDSLDLAKLREEGFVPADVGFITLFLMYKGISQAAAAIS